jgi:hypothetical protein
MTSLDGSEFSAGGIRGGRQKGSKSTAEDLALSGRVDWNVAPGLLLGAGFFGGDTGQGIKDADLEEIEARTVLIEAHAEWKWRGLELRGLYARTRIDDVERLNTALGLTDSSSIGERQSGWYAQAGFDLLTLFGSIDQSLLPFVRHEAYDTQEEVPDGFLRDPTRDVTVTTVGVSWRPIVNVVVKADYQDFDNRSGSGTDQYNLALGFIF